MRSSSVALPFLLALTSAAPSSATQPSNEVEAATLEAEGGETLIELRGSRPPTFTTSSAPGRLIVDLHQALLLEPAKRSLKGGSVLHLGAEQVGAGVRFTIDFVPRLEARFSIEGATLAISFVEGLGEVAGDEGKRARAEAGTQALRGAEEAGALAEAEAEAEADEEEALTEAEAKARREVEEARASAEVEAARETGEEQALAEAEAKAKAKAKAKARREAEEARALAEAEAAREVAEALALAEAEAARKAAEALAEAEVARKAAEALALAEAEAAREAAEAQALAEAEAAREAAEAQALAEAEAEAARKAAEARALAQAEARAQREAQEARAQEARAQEQTEAASRAEALRGLAKAGGAGASRVTAGETRGAAGQGASEGAQVNEPARGSRVTGPIELSQIGFRAGPDAASIVIHHEGRPPYRVREQGGLLLLELEGSTIARPNDRRPIDASFFGTAVGLIRPIELRERSLVRIEIGLRRKGAAYRIRQDDRQLVLEFPHSD